MKGEYFSPLYTDFYELSMAQGYFKNGIAGKVASFDYFYRKQPFGSGYAIFAGLGDMLEAIENYTFQKDDIEFLASLGMEQSFLNYLETFRFRGTIYAPEEGEIIFPNEPLIRVEGSILETQVIETLILNIINFQSLIATKASRMRYVAGDRQLMEFGLRRAQGMGGIMASRAAIIGGANSTSNVYSAKKYGLKTSGTMAHSWVETFEDELTAFRSFVEMYPDNSVLLVDTYDTLNSGVPKAIQVAKEMLTRGHKLTGIRLDSGDLAYLSKKARKMLDDEGLHEVKIIASNQLDEYLIKSLLDQNASLDGFGVGTNLVVGRDDAALDGVYKLAMFDGIPRLKISDNIEKVLLPGIKKVLRYKDDEGFFAGDVIMLSHEVKPSAIHPLTRMSLSLPQLSGNIFHRAVMQDGKILTDKSNPYVINAYVNERLAMLREEHKRFENPHVYSIGVSEQLYGLRQQLVDKHKIG